MPSLSSEQVSDSSPSLDAPSSAAEPSAPSPDKCANCGATLTRPYCGSCGQRAANRVVPLGQMGSEILEHLFDLDLRILRTLPTFFFRPGRLTVEYVQGRRRTYVRPLRLYLFSSFVLFTVLAFTNLDRLSPSFAPDTAAVQQEVEAARHRIDSLQTALVQAALVENKTPGDSLAASTNHHPTIDALQHEMEGIEASLGPTEGALSASKTLLDVLAAPFLPPSPNTRTDAEASIPVQPKLLRLLYNPRDVARDMIDRAPYLMFLLVPTFALLLKGLYLRRRRLYLEHFIFALHVHALAFLVFALSATLGAWDVGTSFSLPGWLATSPFLYLFFAMRTTYDQSVLSTFSKMAVLLISYGIILVGAVVLLAILTVSLT